jgi:hypothetical protein
MRVKIMEDKTPIYLLSIVGIVALVGIVYMLTGNDASAGTNTGSDSLITGNVVNDDIAPVSVNIAGIGRFLLAVVLIGSCLYMYRKWE